VRQALEELGKGGRAVTEANLRAFELGLDAAGAAPLAAQAGR
jgi:Pyruvate/2-oxoacid:ferredoxin oxidoreductase gamma subunit